MLLQLGTRITLAMEKQAMNKLWAPMFGVIHNNTLNVPSSD